MIQKVDLQERVAVQLVRAKELLDPTDPELWFDPKVRKEAEQFYLAAEEAKRCGLLQRAEVELKSFEHRRDLDGKKRAYASFPEKAEAVGLQANPIKVECCAAWSHNGQEGYILTWQEEGIFPSFFGLRTLKTRSLKIHCIEHELDSTSYRCPWNMYQYIGALQKIADPKTIRVFEERPCHGDTGELDPILAVKVGTGWYKVAQWE